MRLLPLIFIMLAGSLVGGEPTAFPLWDGQESVGDYAKKVNLSPTKTLDLGNGVKMELVLIPAGKFVMGTPEPTPVDEDGFRKKILTGQTLLAVSAVALLVMLVVIVVQAIRKKRRPKYSLLWLLLMTVMAGGCVLSGLHWRESVKELKKARMELTAAKARYQAAGIAEKPAHPVTLTKPFYMGTFLVTQEQYESVIGTNPSRLKGKDNPVEMVSWDEAQAFCKKLSKLTEHAVRLPTEAEWEYSCRAGTNTTYYSGDTDKDLDRVAWCYENSKSTTHPVGGKEPNAFGLYDMHGNVCHWCQDLFADNYYGKSPATDPEGPEGPAPGGFRLLRGGSWRSVPMFCRSADRNVDVPGQRSYSIGFRIALIPAPK